MAPNDTVISVRETPDSANSYEMGEKSFPIPMSYPLNSRPSVATSRISIPQDSDKWNDEKIDDDGELSELGMTWQRLRQNVLIRYTFYIVPVAILLAIPIIVFATSHADARIMSHFKEIKLEPVYTSNITSIDDSPTSNITNVYNITSSEIYEQIKTEQDGGIRLLGLFIWIEVVWVLLWVAKLMAQFVPILYQSMAGALRTGIRKYFLVLKAVEIPLSLFFWAILAIASRSIIWTFDQPFHKEYAGKIHWLSVLHSVNKATIGVTALYLVQKLLIQMVSVNYHGKMQYDTIKELETLSRAIETMYDVSRRQFHDSHPAFRDDDLDIHDVRGYRKDKHGRRTATSDSAAIFMTSLGTTGDKITSILGYMASDIAGQQVLTPTASGAVVEAALDRPVAAVALARRIWNSFTDFGANKLDEEAIKVMFGPGNEAQAMYIHRKVDTDGNGDITLVEMVDLVKKVASDRKTIWEGAHNVKDAIKVLDRVLSVFVLIFIVLIYAAFFSDYLANHYTQVWSTFTGCSFLFASTAGELFAACITVFIKHPYDVGDRISINDTDMDVVKISLLYSVFKEVSSRQLVQIPNSSINGLWIRNITRSKELKEQIKLSVCADTSFEDLEALRGQLAVFVAEHKRDFLPEVDLQLLSVSDLKQIELRIEYEHKGNSASEQTRAHRRSKFMCGLLSAMRRVPITPPGGSGPGSGSKESPTYSVTISDEDSKAAKAVFDENKDAKRLHPKNAAPVAAAAAAATDVPVAVGGGASGSTALEILPSLLRQTSRPRTSEDGIYFHR